VPSRYRQCSNTFLKLWNLKQSLSSLGLVTSLELGEWKKKTLKFQSKLNQPGLGTSFGTRRMKKITLKSQTKLKQPWLSNNFGTSRMKKKLWNFYQNWSSLILEEWNKKWVPST
jgi:hypothetical protein